MTKQEALENHRHMWRWIAEQTRIEKRFICEEDYFKAFKKVHKPLLLNRYGCEYIVNNAIQSCEDCIVKWNDYSCMNPHSEYLEWLYSKTWEEATYWAKIIAELPERTI